MFEDFNTFLCFLGTLVTFTALGRNIILKHWDSPAVITNPLLYLILILNLIITLYLPISLWWEFSYGLTSRYASFAFYCERYPHVVIYPVFLFGFASLFIVRTALFHWAISKRGVIKRVIFAMIVAVIASYGETTGGYMMLLEFSKDAQAGAGQFESGDTRRAVKTLGIEEAFTSPMSEQVLAALITGDGKSEIAACLKSYDPWSKLGGIWKSRSRVPYLTMFFYMIFIMALGFSFLPLTKRLVGGDKTLDDLITLNLGGAFIIFLLWIPFRIFYNRHTKVRLFGSDITDNFLGPIPFPKVAGLTPSDVIPSLVIIVFLIFMMFRILEASNLVVISVTALVTVVAFFGSVALAIYNPTAFIDLYGLHGEVKFLAFRVLLLSLLLLLIYAYSSAQIDPPSKFQKGLSK